MKTKKDRLALVIGMQVLLLLIPGLFGWMTISSFYSDELAESLPWIMGGAFAMPVKIWIVRLLGAALFSYTFFECYDQSRKLWKTRSITE